MANLASPPVVVANSSPAAAPETKRITDSRQHTGDHRLGEQNSEGYATVPEPQ
jgi:hypothetical protein